MRLLVPLLAVLLIPASASAAPLGEIPPLELRGSDGDCQGVTGAAGEVAVETNTGVRFVQASRSAFTLGALVQPAGECRAVAASPNGAGVIVAFANGDLLVSVREPGGTWGTEQKIATGTQGGYVDEAAAAISERGDAIVVWSVDGDDGGGVWAVRRAPGGAFGGPERIATAPEGQLRPRITATGEALLLSVRVQPSQPPVRAPVSVRTAPPGAPFGAPARIADGRWLSVPALAVASDGRALVAAWQGDALVVAERAPGSGFAPAIPVGTASGQFVAAGAAIRADGAAAVAWQRFLESDAVVVTRPAGGPFSAPVVAARGESPLPPGFDPFFLSESFLATFQDDLTTIDFETGFGDAVALTADGRAAVAATLGTAHAERLAAVMALGTVPLGGGAAATSTSASRFGGTFSTAQPLILADGSPALVWSEPSAGLGKLRLHLAADGIVEAPDPPTPSVKVGKHKVREGDALIPITCSAACDVRAVIEGTVSVTGGSLRLRRAGTGTLNVSDATDYAPPRRGPVRIRLAYSAPGALHPRERTITIRLKGLPPVPRAIAVTARRDGDDVRVSFRATGTRNIGGFYVTGDDTRDWNGEPLVTRALDATPKRTYSVTLRNARDVRWVTVRATRDLQGGSKTIARVR